MASAACVLPVGVELPQVCYQCGKVLLPLAKQAWWYRGSGLCTKHASFRKRSAMASLPARQWMADWEERERSAREVVEEAAIVYAKDYGSPAKVRKFRVERLLKHREE